MSQNIKAVQSATQRGETQIKPQTIAELRNSIEFGEAEAIRIYGRQVEYVSQKKEVREKIPEICRRVPLSRWLSTDLCMHGMNFYMVGEKIIGKPEAEKFLGSTESLE